MKEAALKVGVNYSIAKHIVRQERKKRETKQTEKEEIKRQKKNNLKQHLRIVESKEEWQNQVEEEDMEEENFVSID